MTPSVPLPSQSLSCTAGTVRRRSPAHPSDWAAAACCARAATGQAAAPPRRVIVTLRRSRHIRFAPQSGHAELNSTCPLSADCVAKVFCPSECVRLIQDQASMRNVDSRIHSLRFDCCVFLFYSSSTVTFATQSANKRHMQCSKLQPTQSPRRLAGGFLLAR
jgi:hypothetical protein